MGECALARGDPARWQPPERGGVSVGAWRAAGNRQNVPKADEQHLGLVVIEQRVVLS